MIQQYLSVNYGVVHWIVWWELLCCYSLSSRTLLIIWFQMNICDSASFVDWFLMARFNLESTLAFAITLRTIRAACAHSTCVALDTLDPINERVERKFRNTSAEGTNNSVPGVSLYGLTAEISQNKFFCLVWLIRRFLIVRLIRSWYPSPIPNALWCCVSDLNHST